MPPTTSPSFHLPHEVLASIVHFVDHKPTLAALLRVCKATYDLASRPLYAEVVVTERSLMGYRVGLLILPREGVKPYVDIYPNVQSDKRKGALLALTTTIHVRSVPKLVNDRELGWCPMNKATFPSARTIRVSTPVPHHRALESQQGRRGRATIAS